MYIIFMTYLDTIKELEIVMNRKLMDIPKRVRLWTVEYQSKNFLPKNIDIIMINLYNIFHIL